MYAHLLFMCEFGVWPARSNSAQCSHQRSPGRANEGDGTHSISFNGFLFFLLLPQQQRSTGALSLNNELNEFGAGEILIRSYRQMYSKFQTIMKTYSRIFTEIAGPCRFGAVFFFTWTENFVDDVSDNLLREGASNCGRKKIVDEFSGERTLFSRVTFAWKRSFISFTAKTKILKINPFIHWVY